MFIESIQIINSTTIISLTKNKENVFLNNFTKPLNEKEKTFYLFVIVLIQTFQKMNF